MTQEFIPPPSLLGDENRMGITEVGDALSKALSNSCATVSGSQEWAEVMTEWSITSRTGDAILARVASLIVKPKNTQVAWLCVVSEMERALLADRSVILPNIGTLVPYVKAASRYRPPPVRNEDGAAKEQKIKTIPKRRFVKLVLARNIKESLRG